MPRISQRFDLEITVEQFLCACSLKELYEINMRMDAHIRRHENARRDPDLISNGIAHSRQLWNPQDPDSLEQGDDG
jgi:hypothetical protein